MIGNFLSYLEATARRVPDRVAFYNDKEQLTFSQLRRAAQAVGSCLGAMMPPRSPAAILMDSRSIWNLPAFLGVVYAGGFYAPMNPSQPAAMLTQLLERLSPAVILTDEKGRKALEGVPVSAPVIALENALGTAVDGELLNQIRRGSSSMDPLSLLYTSGSTGIPKGSIHPHLSYLLWTRAVIDRYGLTEDTVFCNQSPFCHANSVLEIFPPLMLGATVYLLPAWALTFPRKMVELLNERHVTELSMTPSSFIHVVNEGALTDGCLPELKCFVLSGETMPWNPLTAWMRAAPNADWWHFYGSTEMFCVASAKVNGRRQPDGILPVGRPFPMTHVLLLDEDGREAAPGEPGEIFVSSPWMSRGYYREPALTDAVWVHDPLKKGWRETFHRSGDSGCFTPEGELIVLGRRDNQIKHFGYRMDLADVERGLQAIAEVHESCVLYEKESDRVFCFFVSSLDEKALNRALKTHLQSYMLPDVYVRLPEMPHTPSMKIDRAALTHMMKERSVQET